MGNLKRLKPSSQTLRDARLQDVREWLHEQAPGSISDEPGLVARLAEAWPFLSGSNEQSTHPDKLGRLENPTWAPPCLTFLLERHGATVMGSTRASVHQWTVDIDKGAAVCNPHFARRQVSAPDSRLNVKPIAAEIADAILAGRDDSRLKWDKDRQAARVLVGVFIDGCKETRAARGKRFRAAIVPLLAAGG